MNNIYHRDTEYTEKIKKKFLSFYQKLCVFVVILFSIMLFNHCGSKGFNCCVIKLPPIAFSSERTSLEKQILGTYKEIREDVWLVSSAQTVEGLTISSTTNTNIGKELNIDYKVIKALETIEYDKEKIQNFKTKSYMGEDNQGFLQYIENDFIERNPEMKKNLLEIISEVNDARLVLMVEVINRNERFTMDDLPKVKQTFAELNQKNSLAEEWIQLKNNEWIKKK